MWHVSVQCVNRQSHVVAATAARLRLFRCFPKIPHHGFLSQNDIWCRMTTQWHPTGQRIWFLPNIGISNFLCGMYQFNACIDSQATRGRRHCCQIRLYLSIPKIRHHGFVSQNDIWCRMSTQWHETGQRIWFLPYIGISNFLFCMARCVWFGSTTMVRPLLAPLLLGRDFMRSIPKIPQYGFLSQNDIWCRMTTQWAPTGQRIWFLPYIGIINFLCCMAPCLWFGPTTLVADCWYHSCQIVILP